MGSGAVVLRIARNNDPLRSNQSEVQPDGSVTDAEFGTQIKGVTDMAFDPLTEKLYLVGRGKDIIFSNGEGLDGLYTITFVD